MAKFVSSPQPISNALSGWASPVAVRDPGDAVSVCASCFYFTGAGAASVNPATVLIRPSGASEAKSVPPR